MPSDDNKQNKDTESDFEISKKAWTLASQRPPNVDRILYTLRMIVGLLLIVALYQSVQKSEIDRLIDGVNYLYLVPAVLCFFLSIAFKSFTWIYLAKSVGLEIPLKKALKLKMVGYTLNSIFPANLFGETWRAMITGVEKNRLGLSFAVVLVEKWASFTGLVIIAAASFFFGQGVFTITKIYTPALFAIIVSVVLIILSVALLPWLTRGGILFFTRWNILGDLAMGLKSLREFQDKAKAVAVGVLVSTLSVGFSIGALYLAARAVGFFVPLYALVLLTTAVRVVNRIPVSVNGIGAQDILIVLFARQFFVVRETAVVFSLMIHIMKIFVIAVGWLINLSSPLPWQKPFDGMDGTDEDE